MQTPHCNLEGHFVSAHAQVVATGSSIGLDAGSTPLAPKHETTAQSYFAQAPEVQLLRQSD
jgi:hypothetical protein